MAPLHIFGNSGLAFQECSEYAGFADDGRQPSLIGIAMFPLSEG